MPYYEVELIQDVQYFLAVPVEAGSPEEAEARVMAMDNVELDELTGADVVDVEWHVEGVESLGEEEFLRATVAEVVPKAQGKVVALPNRKGA